MVSMYISIVYWGCLCETCVIQLKLKMNLPILLLFVSLTRLIVICRASSPRTLFMKASTDKEVTVDVDLLSHLKNKKEIKILIHIFEKHEIPESFDTRVKWPKCANVINYIRDDGGYCRISFASAVAGMLSDRECIITNGEVQNNLSVEELITCCPECASQEGKVCQTGGAADVALDFWIEKGIVTGGNLDSNEGCKPLSKALYYGDLGKCENNCTNDQYTTPYEKDKHFGTFKYRISDEHIQMEREIMHHGSIVAEITVYENLFFHRKGVYDKHTGKNYGKQVIRIIGWGVENGKKYWLAANSWGELYGEKRFFKILRGENFCDIASNVIAGRKSSKLSPREYLIPGGTTSIRVNLILIFCTYIVLGAIK